MVNYLSKNEINSAIQNAASSGQFYYTVVLTLAKTGCRVSELINIKPQDILIDEKQIIIRGKGDIIRNIDISDDLLLQLELYIKNSKIRKNQSLFKRSRQNITQITKRFAKVNAHAFRHSYAIALLRKTKNIRYVQKQLGHSSMATTQIYLQFMTFNEEKGKLGELYS